MPGTADETMYRSSSKNSPDLSFCKTPRALAMSAATDGFSAMIRGFPHRRERADV